MRVGFACVTLCIILSFLAPGIALSPGKSEEATKEFKEAVELIKSGNNSLSSNCDDAAYCLYDSAVTRLNGIKGKYPDWNREKVMKERCWLMPPAGMGSLGTSLSWDYLSTAERKRIIL